jgi:hypothetical protein
MDSQAAKLDARWRNIRSGDQGLNSEPTFLKLRLRKASRETSQVDRLPAPSHLPRVNVYLPGIEPDLLLISGR